MKGIAILLLLFLTSELLVEPSFQADLTCGEVVMTMHKCVTYMTGAELTPPHICCEDLQRLIGMMLTPEDKVQACTCIRHATRRIHNLKESFVSALAAECRVDLPFRISTAMDCTRVQA